MSAASAIVLLTAQANAQPIYVPQAAAYTPDANTVLLEHFDGSTSGATHGSASYVNGVFGQAVHLNIDNWISWSKGGLPQGTVEFWGKMDTPNSYYTEAGFLRAGRAPFWDDTFETSVMTNGAHSRYQSGETWIGLATNAPGPLITANGWHHYATTWGPNGFHFYVDGILAYSAPDTGVQNPATTVWAIGGPNTWPFNSGPGFTGAIDELRISDIQRTFVALPTLSIETAAIRLSWFAESNVTYQVQASSDFVTWSPLVSVIGTGAETTVTHWTDYGTRMFYRVAVEP